jgi:ketosteroid isomerase-like protein
MRISLFLASLLIASSLIAQTPSADSTAASAVATAFHTAVKTGNATAAAQLLGDDSIFMESGGIETRAEYVKNHLPEDIKFEKAVTSAWKSYRTVTQGDVAWVTSTEDITGTFEGSPVNLGVVELMVLSRQNGTWKIRSIAWSSRRRQ